MALKIRFSEKNITECGCDEAGRGAIAGPLFTAAIILPDDYYNPKINDSKQLTRKVREELRKEIEREALAYAVVPVDAKEIDQVNILNATFIGMNRAILSLKVIPELLLIDGNRFKNETPYPYQCCIQGDARYQSIAAASILAKTYRDEYMELLHEEYPAYDWQNNKGYPTGKHQKAVLELGRTPYHRKSFQLKNQLKLDF